MMRYLAGRTTSKRSSLEDLAGKSISPALSSRPSNALVSPTKVIFTLFCPRFLDEGKIPRFLPSLLHR
jgi:hypothetical protein